MPAHTRRALLICGPLAVLAAGVGLAAPPTAAPPTPAPLRPEVLVDEVVEEPAAATPAEKDGPMLAHMVFFTLKDSSPANRAALVAACEKYLSGHEGVAHFSAGSRAEAMDRAVNDTDFDVALHVVFETLADHDRYQTHPRHLQFIEENKSTWGTVRVFDSEVGG